MRLCFTIVWNIVTDPLGNESTPKIVKLVSLMKLRCICLAGMTPWICDIVGSFDSVKMVQYVNPDICTESNVWIH